MVDQDDLSAFSMADLFRIEVETQGQVLSNGLVELEKNPTSAPLLKELMRSAHSLKGAARIVNYEAAVQVAHVMEDVFVAAQKEQIYLQPAQIDALLSSLDLISRMSRVSEQEIAQWEKEHGDEIAVCITQLTSTSQNETPLPADPLPPPSTGTEEPEEQPQPRSAEEKEASERTGRALRIDAKNLNRLLGLAGESLLASRWLETFATDLLRLKRDQQEMLRQMHGFEGAVMGRLDDMSATALSVLHEHVRTIENTTSKRLEELDFFQRTLTGLSTRLYQEVLDSRMRPFGDAVQGFSRMVRDVSRSLGKKVRLELAGLATPVDRDIIERLEAPLSHLLRNAIDHGIEDAEHRLQAGKSADANIRLEARHTAGMLFIQVADDGRGIDVEAIRNAVVAHKLTTTDLAAKMSEQELFEFLFLPGFSMKEQITEISGRGVGLDVVHTMVHEAGGTIRINSTPGQGTQFQLLLPLTLSVLRTLVVKIGGEPYAFPLARIHSTAKVPADCIETIESRQHFVHQNSHVGIVTAHQVLGLDSPLAPDNELPVVLLEDHGNQYALVVDELLDERELVVLPLDPRLGKVPNISSAALMPDRSPVLIFDTDDLFRSIENLISGERLVGVQSHAAAAQSARKKRILVVDDSLTVRELERKLLTAGGYDVEVAVDGMDGWNAIRVSQYDLIVTDVDMPRMDGIELVTLIRQDPRLTSLPVIIVSYKDRIEDRQRGLDAGADYYLTKGSFQDETLLRAVQALVGKARS